MDAPSRRVVRWLDVRALELRARGVITYVETMSTPSATTVGRSASSKVLVCRQWWKVCWVYGDQYKQYRELYGRKRTTTVHVQQAL